MQNDIITFDVIAPLITSYHHSFKDILNFKLSNINIQKNERNLILGKIMVAIALKEVLQPYPKIGKFCDLSQNYQHPPFGHFSHYVGDVGSLIYILTLGFEIKLGSTTLLAELWCTSLWTLFLLFEHVSHYIQWYGGVGSLIHILTWSFEFILASASLLAELWCTSLLEPLPSFEHFSHCKEWYRGCGTFDLYSHLEFWDHTVLCIIASWVMIH